MGSVKFMPTVRNVKAQSWFMCFPIFKDFVEIGVITSIQSNHKEQETARKGEEVCIKVEPVPGEAPKMFGRHFDENDMVVSKISRTSIDACKEYFRDDLQKSDWQLMIELKKTFEILWKGSLVSYLDCHFHHMASNG